LGAAPPVLDLPHYWTTELTWPTYIREKNDCPMKNDPFGFALGASTMLGGTRSSQKHFMGDRQTAK